METGIIKRGCMSDLNENDRQRYRNGSNKTLICHGDNCNLNTKFQTCYECDQYYANCFEHIKFLDEVTCNVGINDCYTTLLVILHEGDALVTILSKVLKIVVIHQFVNVVPVNVYAISKR